MIWDWNKGSGDELPGYGGKLFDADGVDIGAENKFVWWANTETGVIQSLMEDPKGGILIEPGADEVTSYTKTYKPPLRYEPGLYDKDFKPLEK